MKYPILMKCLVALGMCSWLGACAGTSEPEGDPRDESFLVAGKADGLGVEEGSPEARAILDVVNTYSLHRMIRDVRLTWHASKNISNWVKGPDGVRGTDDDDLVNSLAELDRIPYIGKKSSEALVAYVLENDLVSEYELEFSDEVPAALTSQGAAFRATLGAREALAIPLRAERGDRILMWLRKADEVQWNPKLSIVALDSSETVAWANPWGNSDARLPHDPEDASRGFVIDEDGLRYQVVLENMAQVEGSLEFVLQCVGGPCFSDSNDMVLDGDFRELEDDALRRQMVARHEQTHVFLDYHTARDWMFSVIDNQDGVVECVYTGEKVETDAIPPADIMNAEHTWPQSRGAVDGAARSDLHHLFPVMAVANSTRGAYEFCEVEEVARALGPATYGYDAEEQRCFEPRDAHKGDAARALFYYAAVYQQAISPEEERVLRRWHVEDPVDMWEMRRNDRIEQVQGSRNFFVDDPTLTDRIRDF